MNRITRTTINTLAAAGLAGLGLTGLGVNSASALTPAFGDMNLELAGEATCPKAGKVDVGGEVHSLDVFAPVGKLIAGYCVKAGSAQQGNGPETTMLDVPTSQMTLSHSSGKAISHYTLILVDEPQPELPIKDADPVDPDPELDFPIKDADPVDPEPFDDFPITDADPVDPDPELDFPIKDADPVDPVDPEVPGDEQDSEAPVPGDEPQGQQGTTELPTTGTTSTLLAALAAALTGLGLIARRFGRTITA